MHFEVLSDRPCLIDAIGELKSGEAIVVDDDQLKLFKIIHGVTLQGAKFPPGVSVTCVLDEPTPEEG